MPFVLAPTMARLRRLSFRSIARQDLSLLARFSHAARRAGAQTGSASQGPGRRPLSRALATLNQEPIEAHRRDRTRMNPAPVITDSRPAEAERFSTAKITTALTAIKHGAPHGAQGDHVGPTGFDAGDPRRKFSCRKGYPDQPKAKITGTSGTEPGLATRCCEPRPRCLAQGYGVLVGVSL